MANIHDREHRSHPLTGQYVRQGGKLTSPTTTLLLVTRKATTPAKAEVYVLRVHQDGRRSYVSSLWDGPVAGTYALEYGRQRYTLTLTDQAAEVVHEQGCVAYSSTHPVAKTATRSTTGTTSIDPAP